MLSGWGLITLGLIMSAGLVVFVMLRFNAGRMALALLTFVMGISIVANGALFMPPENIIGGRVLIELLKAVWFGSSESQRQLLVGFLCIYLALILALYAWASNRQKGGFTNGEESENAG